MISLAGTFDMNIERKNIVPGIIFLLLLLLAGVDTHTVELDISHEAGTRSLVD